MLYYHFHIYQNFPRRNVAFLIMQFSSQTRYNDRALHVHTSLGGEYIVKSKNKQQAHHSISYLPFTHINFYIFSHLHTITSLASLCILVVQSVPKYLALIETAWFSLLFTFFLTKKAQSHCFWLFLRVYEFLKHDLLI